MTAPRAMPPSVRRIAEHWAGRVPPGATEPPHAWDADEPSCWACGWWHPFSETPGRGIERAHVVPHAEGGSDTDPANFALLCHPCHVAAPDTSDAAWFWRWVENRPRRSPMDDEVERWNEIAAAVLDAVPADLTTRLAANPDQIAKVLRDVADELRPVPHDGRYSTGTAARLIVGTLQRLDELTHPPMRPPEPAAEPPPLS